ncbi:unannotated protein [freshwater metagenome]|uniref:Unannotated protein n=1 Tax=freshwater metagenome TaxID=449393 RepID=A0A6J7DAC9_9ZZZZ
MPEVRSTDASVDGSIDASFGPNVRNAVRARTADRYGVSAPETGFRIVRDASGHGLAGDRVAHEDHTSIESPDGKATVCDSRQRQFDISTNRFTHLPSLRSG